MTEEKWVLVTGSGGGIGKGIASVLASRGWRVVVNDLNEDAARATADELGTVGVPGTVDDDELIPRVLAATGGSLHGLVNNAGVIRRGALADLTHGDFDLTIGVNLRATVFLSRDALPHLAKTGGAIVNVTSMTAESPQLGAGMYSASKAAVTAFTRQAAIEWGPLGVRVNALAPGMIRSAMAGAYTDAELAEARRAIVPAGRIGTPEDAGAVAAFLLGPDSAYVSGETILVDGAFAHSLVAHIPQVAAH